jgi:hypothetical protein
VRITSDLDTCSPIFKDVFLGSSRRFRSPRRGLTFLGALAIISAVMGFIASASIRCCLSVYMTFAATVLLAQAGLVIYLFIAPLHAITTLAGYDDSEENTG